MKNFCLEMVSLHIDNTICSSQIIEKNPILQDTPQNRLQYLKYIKHYIKKSGLNNRKIVKSQMSIYNSVLSEPEMQMNDEIELDEKYKYLLLFDFLFITAFDVTSAKNVSAINTIVKENHYERSVFNNIISYCSGNLNSWIKIKKTKNYEMFPEYLSLFKENFEFIIKKKYKILITATMSAGKSTFINALCGKNVTLSQNMACTSQLHSIIGKPFEDDYVCESDYDLTIDAGSNELLNDNSKNKSGRIKVSTFFRGNLAGQAVILNDTPGVNSSQNDDHKEIADSIIKRRKYDLIVYLLNATQLGTNDDEEHLLFVKNNIGNKPVIFIINKIDELDIEDEDPIQLIEKQRGYLKKLGYNDPIVCPLSSRYGLLAKKRKFDELSRLESRELDRVIMDFEDVNYSEYYKTNFKDICVDVSENEIDSFLINCGLEYVERILCKYIEIKENKNG